MRQLPGAEAIPRPPIPTRAGDPPPPPTGRLSPTGPLATPHPKAGVIQAAEVEPGFPYEARRFRPLAASAASSRRAALAMVSLAKLQAPPPASISSTVRVAARAWSGRSATQAETA